MARLTSKARKALPKSDFAGPGRSYPMQDKAHARAALSYGARYASPATLSKIKSRARAMGIDVGGDGKVFADHHNATEV